MAYTIPVEGGFEFADCEDAYTYNPTATMRTRARVPRRYVLPRLPRCLRLFRMLDGGIGGNQQLLIVFPGSNTIR